MFAITGITGQVGGEVARNLLAARHSVRAVVRDVGKGKAWAERGCDLVSADINDPAALTAAFKASMVCSFSCRLTSIRHLTFAKRGQWPRR